MRGTLYAAVLAGMMMASTASAQTILSKTHPAIPELPPVSHLPLLPGEPADPDPASYGIDKQTGIFKHPAMTPESEGPHPFPGSLNYVDLNQYAENAKMEAFYPFVVSTGHTWHATVDMNGKRYLYDYYRNHYQVYDITDPRKVEMVGEKFFKNYDEPFGPFNVQYNKQLGKYIAVQCYETPRYGVIDSKYINPHKTDLIRKMKFLRGFRIYELTSPTDWKVLAEVPLDPKATADQRPHQGSGCLDVPYYVGEKYLFVAGAPDDSYSLQEYKSYLFSAAHLAYDISDPAKPKLLSIWSAPGQKVGEEEAYKKNPRVGGMTAWMGARMPLFIPRAPEHGGKYGYAAMGGLGLYVIDISDPANMRTVGHLEMPVSVAGNEGDNIDVSKVEDTGMIYFSGYPMNQDCYEPYKDIYQIDVRDPANPKIAGVLPRPQPPKEAGFTDYCQRRGSFGPKRAGYLNQPGTPSDRYIPYAFYNAGMQIFDVANPQKPAIAAYFVPKMALETSDLKTLDYDNPTHGIFVEWDRKLIWLFTNHGLYAVSSSLLGAPVFTLPQ